ncbi:hypothetical protein [Undibacterium squillarum]|uniref:hypothetical protein n=1 Tax=Undibacterium squillarum TaxID=1131567 RepID=UPI0035B15114
MQKSAFSPVSAILWQFRCCRSEDKINVMSDQIFPPDVVLPLSAKQPALTDRSIGQIRKFVVPMTQNKKGLDILDC